MDPLIDRLNKAGVRYLLMGGQAMRLCGMPRFSMDWDFLLPPSDEENFRSINEALADELDLPVAPLGPAGENFVQTYQTRWGVVQFHLGAPGLPSFEDAYSRRRTAHTESGTPLPCLSGEDLLAAKKRANRPQDQQDIAFLERKKGLGLL